MLSFFSLNIWIQQVFIFYSKILLKYTFNFCKRLILRIKKNILRKKSAAVIGEEFNLVHTDSDVLCAIPNKPDSKINT